MIRIVRPAALPVRIAYVSAGYITVTGAPVMLPVNGLDLRRI